MDGVVPKLTPSGPGPAGYLEGQALEPQRRVAGHQGPPGTLQSAREGLFNSLTTRDRRPRSRNAASTLQIQPDFSSQLALLIELQDQAASPPTPSEGPRSPAWDGLLC